MEKNSLINEKGATPLYHQLKDLLLEKIEIEVWKPGTPIPSEKEMAKEYGLSIGTVRKALDELVRTNLLYRKQGKGTFVLPSKIDINLDRITTFADLAKQSGFRLESKILEMKIIKPTSYEANILKITNDTDIIRILRLRFVNKEPAVFQKIFIPFKFCPDLINDDVSSLSLYETLKNKYNISLIALEQFIESILIDSYEATILKIKTNSPAFLAIHIAFNELNLPIVLSKDIIRGDLYRYRIKLYSDIMLERR